MDKGWGLALDSCPSPTLPPFSSSSSKLHPHTPFTAPNERMFPLLGFPVNLTRPYNNKEEHDDDDAEHDNNKHRKVVGEVDFFSDRNKTTTPPGHDHVTNPNNIVSVKKENIHPNDEQALNVNTGLQLLTGNTGNDQSTVDDGVSSDAEDKRAKSSELAMLQVELQRMNAENQKLKEMLTHVSGNYTALQMHLATLMQHHRTSQNEGKSCEEKKADVGGVMGPRQFLDLVPDDQKVSNSSSDERTRSSTPQNNSNTTSHLHHEVAVMRNNNGKTSTEMGREESPDSESQGWASNKHQKLNPSSNASAMDQSSSEATMRKARVSVRARSEAPMISDGCQWRKYGQKMAKGNPCPRAYYRCTMAVGCPVRKQVQRCAEDRTILVTTYEGTHNHPLPPAAMAMASTTSAAATMLLSGSMSSADGIMNPNLLARAILPCSSSMATLSASAPFPTVTLDLTHNPASSNPLQQAQIRPPTHHHPAPLFQQVPFQGHPQNNFGAGAGALYNQSRFSGLQLSHEMGSSQLALQASRPPLQQQNQLQQQPSLADSVTAAITTDPNFTAVLAAAISSIIGSGGAHPNNNHNTNSNVTNRSTTISNLSGN